MTEHTYSPDNIEQARELTLMIEELARADHPEKATIAPLLAAARNLLQLGRQNDRASYDAARCAEAILYSDGKTLVKILKDVTHKYESRETTQPELPLK